MSGVKELAKIANQWGGRTSILFSYAHASHDLCTGLLVPLLPLIRVSLGLTYLQSGLLLSVYSITSGFSQFLGGWLGDQLGQRVVAAVGLACVGLTTIAVGFSTSYYPMLIILVMMGIFAGAYHPSALPMLSSYYSAERRGKVIGLHMVGGTLGFTIGPVLGGVIAYWLDYNFAFIILGFPALVGAFLLLTKLARGNSVPESETTNRTTNISQIPEGIPGRSVNLSQALRPITIILILAILMQFVGETTTTFIPLYLVDKHGVTPTHAALLLGVLRGSGIAGSLFGGWVPNKWGRRRVIVLTLVITGPILYLFTILPFNAFLISALAIFGVVMIMREVLVQTLLINSAPSHLRATIFGLYFGLSMGGMSLMQPVAGHFMDIYGISEVFSLIALVGVVLSLAALLGIRYVLKHSVPLVTS